MGNNKGKGSYGVAGISGCMKAAVAVLFVFVLFLFLHGFFVLDQADFVRDSLGKGSQFVAVFVAFGFVTLLFFCIWNGLEHLGEKKLRAVYYVGFGVMIVLQFVFLFCFCSMYLWDGAFVIGGANSLVETGCISEDAFYYLSVYKNQHPFVVLTAGLLRIGKAFSLESGGQYLLLNFVNLICIDTAIFFLLQCRTILLKLKGRSEEEVLRGKTCLLLMIALNPFVYVCVSYYYTITLSLPFFLGGIYYAHRAYTDGQHMRNKAVLAGLLFGIGFALRATTIIPVIAATIVGILLFVIRKEVKILVRSLLLFAVTIVTGALLCSASYKVVGIDTTDSAFPTTHWLMMSLTSPGCHNAEDEAFTAGFATKEEKEAAVKERLIMKLKELGIGGYARLAVDKVKYTWESGNHAYSFFTGNCLRKGGAYELVFGNRKDVLALYGQGYYLFLLAGMLGFLIQFLKSKMTEANITYFAQKFVAPFTLLGGFLFYILWETGTQYSLVFFPLFFLMAADGWKNVCETVNGLLSQKRNGLKGLTGAYMMAGAVLCLLLAAFMVKNRVVFTKQPFEGTNTVVLQLLANSPVTLNDGEILTQEVIADKPFYKLVFQFRNFTLEEENDSVYTVRLIEKEKDRLVFEEEIIGKGQPHNGAFVKEMEKQPAGTYELEIVKKSGEKSLAFVTYEMGGYDAYPRGACCINGREERRDLMMGLYGQEEAAYISTFKYLCFGGVMFLIFLFCGFCDRMSVREREQA